MNFPPFWARGSHGAATCWRWSEHSRDEAAALADAAARALAQRAARTGWSREARYPYGDRPLREPVLLEVKSDQGVRAAVLTRNAYGCVVLNTARALFVDVDLPEATRGEAPVAEALGRAEAWASAHPGWGWRVYRTRAGLRLLATHALFDPDRALADPLFDRVGADPLYRRLCQAQHCFRARLTPKPWRCGAGLPPARWPFADPGAEAGFQQWEVAYRARSREFATCELLACVGNPQVHPEVAVVVAVHDQATRLGSGLRLA